MDLRAARKASSLLAGVSTNAADNVAYGLLPGGSNIANRNRAANHFSTASDGDSSASLQVTAHTLPDFNCLASGSSHSKVFALDLGILNPGARLAA